jgi:membrane protein implicated in regulation of membrane protease activity
MRADVRSGGQAGGVPIDLVLVVAAFLAFMAVGVWFTVRSGGPLWLVAWVAVGITAVAVMRPVFRRRRRVDAEGQRKVGHDGSWTSGEEEE